ncbi:T9SS C-terminal target domain-containing protein [Saprospira grandis]|uniref:T9SS C-terminal target domain-containing protein n=1 Tax=Saprospira grandis TaxID=1008 RepID=UPI0022DD6470|nr:T9SS C-terminal target domain-containing protein [Saprospira grandis]WBM73324.1 T9SS type A sorting domain-containing protein [Saprospira grandis]
MKYIQPLIIAFLSFPLLLWAQDPPSAQVWMQANRLSALIKNGGDLFNDGQNAAFLTPKKADSSEHLAAIGLLGLSLGGQNAAGDLYLAAQTYGQGAPDFWPGPIDSLSQQADSLLARRFNYIWTVELLDIWTALEDYRDNGQIDGPLPSSLLIWPARGNAYYPQNLGFALPEQSLAPFFDRDGDGRYEPYEGDFPTYRMGDSTALADQIFWTVLNDLSGGHQFTQGDAMGLEVQLTAYAFGCLALEQSLRESLFLNYKIINRSNQDYQQFWAGFYTDFDLGCPADDYIGTDSSLQTVYTYNADYLDQTQLCQSDNYGSQPPVVALSFLNCSLDRSIYNLNSNLPPFGHPSGPNMDQEFYHLLAGRWSNGQPIRPYASGYDSLGQGQSAYVFPHYPFDSSAGAWWAGDGYSWAQGQDFRVMASHFKGDLLVGESLEIDLMLSYHYADSLTGLYQMLRLLPQNIPSLQQAWAQGIGRGACYQPQDFSASISGYLYEDQNANCQKDSHERLFVQQFICAERQGQRYYATTDSLGFYQFNALPFGEYQLWAVRPSHYWQDACQLQGQYTVQLQHPQGQQQNIALQALDHCPFLQIQLDGANLDACSEQQQWLNYENRGSDTAYQAYVELFWPSRLHLDSASLPFIQIDSQSYRIDLGDLAPQASGQLDIWSSLTCDSVLAGQAFCLEAHVYPDSLCRPIYQETVLAVSAECEGDSIVFYLQNIGLASLVPVRTQLIVIEDDLMQPPFPVTIYGAGVTEVRIPVQPGLSYRALLEQASGNWSAPVISDAIEGCGLDSLGQMHLGYIQQLANLPATVFGAEHCIVLQDSFKSLGHPQAQVLPLGYAAPAYIFPSDPLHVQFLLRGPFKGQLRLRDSLSPYLLPSSLRQQASSHSANWALEEQGILKVDFGFIDLAAEEELLFSYAIEQQKNNRPSSLIRQQWSYQKDSLPWAFTALNSRVVGHNFFSVLSSAPASTARPLAYRFWPLPAQERLNYSALQGWEQGQEIRIYNMLGQELGRYPLLGPQGQIQLGDWPNGVYLLQLFSADRQLLGQQQFSISP